MFGTPFFSFGRDFGGISCYTQLKGVGLKGIKLLNRTTKTTTWKRGRIVFLGFVFSYRKVSSSNRYVAPLEPRYAILVSW